nr:immunoglobulin heavy chain junction region [Mus musculus]
CARSGFTTVVPFDYW